jgi:hypothetical protein
MMTREGHLQSFSAWHDDAGEIIRGGQLSSAQGERFGSLFLEKLLTLHAQESLTDQEAIFLENTVQTTSSIIKYLLEQQHYDLPRDREMARNLTDRAVEFLCQTDPTVVRLNEWPDSEVQRAVKSTALVAGTPFNVVREPKLRPLAEGYAVVATLMLATMLRDNSGALIDTYLLEKMQNMAVLYDTIDRK